MKIGQLRKERVRRGLSQKEVARCLSVSQPYVVMLEKGNRTLTPALAKKLMTVCHFPPTVLPLAVDEPKPMDSKQLADDLAALGYPGYAYLKPNVESKNPAEVLLTALAQNSLEPRLVEALPWLLLRYWEMDFSWLVTQAKKLDLQNRLGFFVNLARQVSQTKHNRARTHTLMELECLLDRSRLVREDDFLGPVRTDVERQWLEQNRPEEAKYWNVLTDLRPQHLGYDA